MLTQKISAILESTLTQLEDVDTDLDTIQQQHVKVVQAAFLAGLAMQPTTEKNPLRLWLAYAASIGIDLY